MSQYALLNEAASAVIDIKVDSDARHAERAGLNPEYGRRWRLLVVDARPSVAETQVAEQNDRFDQLVIEATQVRTTWVVRDKTAGEIELEAIGVEFAGIDALLADLVAQRAIDRPTWDAMNANQLRAEQWRDRQALLRAVHFMLRRIKRGGG